MSEPFLAEIKVISFDFAPKGWALCNGQLLPINQNQALFSLLGTTYGGNGQTTFALPDLRGRMPVHVGSGLPLGGLGGRDVHTLLHGEMPQHTHLAPASGLPAALGDPGAAVFGSSLNEAVFAGGPTGSMAAATSTNVGSSQPHENRQPYLVLNFVIALQGIFPSRN